MKFFFDKEVSHLVKQYKWKIDRNGYVYSSSNKQTVYLHTMIWRYYYGTINSNYVIKHKNDNKLDNKIDNLIETKRSNYHVKHLKEKHREYKTNHYVLIKQRAINLLGGKCILCGISDFRCLEIDHIIPIHSRDNNNHGYALWRKIINKEVINNIQILCANCHAIKTWENGDKRRY